MIGDIKNNYCEYCEKKIIMHNKNLSNQRKYRFLYYIIIITVFVDVFLLRYEEYTVRNLPLDFKDYKFRFHDYKRLQQI